MIDAGAVREILTRGTIDVDGRVLPASNVTLVGEAELDGTRLRCVYKPVSGERPLWDFPSGTFAGREVAAYEISELAGWHVVPVTVLADGPFGRGMVQEWIDVGDDDLVDLVPEGAVPDGWRHVLDAYDGADQPVSLVHADVRGLRRMAVFDAVVNNADRKAGHVLVSPDDRVRGATTGSRSTSRTSCGPCCGAGRATGSPRGRGAAPARRGAGERRRRRSAGGSGQPGRAVPATAPGARADPVGLLPGAAGELARGPVAGLLKRHG